MDRASILLTAPWDLAGVKRSLLCAVAVLNSNHISQVKPDPLKFYYGVVKSIPWRYLENLKAKRLWFGMVRVCHFDPAPCTRCSVYLAARYTG